MPSRNLTPAELDVLAASLVERAELLRDATAAGRTPDAGDLIGLLRGAEDLHRQIAGVALRRPDAAPEGVVLELGDALLRVSDCLEVVIGAVDAASSTVRSTLEDHDDGRPPASWAA